MISVWYRRLLVILAVGSLFTNLGLYLFTGAELEIPPLLWVVAVAVGAVPLLGSGRGNTAVLRSPVVAWAFAFASITAMWILLEPTASTGAWQEFGIRGTAAIALVAMVAIFSSNDAIRWARWCVLGAVLLAVSLNVYELFNPTTFSMVLGRSAGLYRNPNQAGAAIIVGMIVTTSLLPQKYRLLYAFVAGIGVFLTFSRSAAFGWVLANAVAVAVGTINLRRATLVASCVLAVVVTCVVWQWDTLGGELEDLGVLNHNVLSRIGASDDGLGSDHSSEQRAEVAGAAWGMFEDSPLIGHGVAASIDWQYEVSSHNQYLNLMVDHGFLGAFILPALLFAVWWRSRGDARRCAWTLSTFVLFFGFFSHNILSERYFLLSFALMGAMAAGSRSSETERSVQPVQVESAPVLNEGMTLAPCVE